MKTLAFLRAASMTLIAAAGISGMGSGTPDIAYYASAPESIEVTLRDVRASNEKVAMAGHGTREQRTSNFRRGLEGGAGACLDDFQQPS